MAQDGIDIGTFNDLFTIHSVTSTIGSKGQRVEAMSTMRNAFGQVLINVNDEAEDNYNVVSMQTLEITTYNDDAVFEKDKIEYEGKMFDILKIERLKWNRFMRLTAKLIIDE